MFNLLQRVRVITAGPEVHEVVGIVIGRTIEADPRYDVRLEDGTILRNIRLDLADDNKMLTHHIAGFV